MIASLKGQLAEVHQDTVVIDCQGVGYEVFVSLNTVAELQGLRGQAVHLSIHTHVREDALHLFGFVTYAEKQLFLSLLKVNGIGPKLAMNMLSGASVDQIVTMIENEDVKALTTLPKVGKKTAEQIILTLKGKLVNAQEKPPELGSRAQISSALVNLGFRPQDVDRVVKGLPVDIDMQEGLRQGLAVLTNL